MDFLISTAQAQTAPGAPAPGGGMSSIFMMIAMFAIFYFMLIRPQMKRAKETKAMIEALQKGDEVVTAGGIVGKIVSLNENYVTLEIADNAQILVQRQAVQMPLPKGTMKSLR